MYVRFWEAVTTKAAKLMCQSHVFHASESNQVAMKMARLQLSFAIHQNTIIYRVIVYNTTIDLIVVCLEDHFDQPVYRTYSTMEQLLLKACRMESHDEELATITEHYSPDIHMANLKMQLPTLSTNLNPDNNVSLHYVVKYLQDCPRWVDHSTLRLSPW